MPVYLLHSTVPLQRANGQTVRHYLGYCEPGNLLSRWEQHKKGRGSTPVVRAMVARGGRLLMGNYWPTLTRTDERRMKRNGHLSGRCLVCQVREVLRRFDALHSLVKNSASTSTAPSNALEPNSLEPNGVAARARTAG